MKTKIIDFLKKENIELYGVCDDAALTVRMPHLTERAGFGDGSGIKSLLCLCIPYFCGYPENFSAYAAAPDYHKYCEELFDRLIPLLTECFDGYHFYGFADKSPYNEVEAFERANLGKRGDNMLFLTEKYSSFVFLAEVVTDMPAHLWEIAEKEPTAPCIHCGACQRACPSLNANMECLSAITQKKGELTDCERALIKQNKSAWGCDICQAVCPVTKMAINNGTVFTEIDYFKNGRIEKLTEELVTNMNDEEFKSRAFSWRGKAPLLRNLTILSED